MQKKTFLTPYCSTLAPLDRNRLSPPPLTHKESCIYYTFTCIPRARQRFGKDEQKKSNCWEGSIIIRRIWYSVVSYSVSALEGMECQHHTCSGQFYVQNIYFRKETGMLQEINPLSFKTMKNLDSFKRDISFPLAVATLTFY